MIPISPSVSRRSSLEHRHALPTLSLLRRARLDPRGIASDAYAMSVDDQLKATLQRIEKGGAPKYHQKNGETGKLFARDRIARLTDAGSFIEDAALANHRDPELPADGVITGTACIDGRSVAIMANDS